MASAELYIFDVKILRIVDGDTIDVDIDLGFDVHVLERTRLYGVDTPELNSSDEGERRRAKLAAKRVEQLLPVGSTQLMVSEEFRRGKYGRVLARFMTPEGDDLGELLIREGHAKTY